MELNEEEIISSAKRGDQGAFAWLYRKHLSSVRSTGRAILHTNDLDDLAQETFLLAFTRIASFDGKSSFRVWVTHIAMNQCLTILRKSKQDGRTEELDAMENIFSEEDDNLRAAPARIDVGRLLGELRPKERSLLEMAYLRGDSYSEIADHLGSDPSQVKSGLFRAKKKLKINGIEVAASLNPLLLKSLLSFLILSASLAYAGTVSGTLQGPSGLPIKNGTLAFNLQQAGLIIGTGSVVPLTASCYTSVDGSVVGLPNPLTNIVSSVNYGSGTLPGGIYYVELTLYSGSQETLPSPELKIQLTGAGTLTISPPVSFPPNATGMRVYIGTSSGAEQLQGSTTGGSTQFSQAAALSSGAATPSSNTSVCSIAFNDTIIPYSGYNVSLTSSSGNAYPGWPQAWQLNGGLNGTVNISNGAPLWNGVIVYPQPIVAQPLNHGPQSIAGNLNMGGYDIVNVGDLGAGGNVTPGWPIDANGLINASGGYLYNGAAPNNHVLLGNGTAYVDSASIPSSAISNLFYQVMEANGTAEPQENALNFASTFALTDFSGYSTSVDLASSGVTAGSYTNPNLTINAKGQVTAASSGSTTTYKIQSLIITTGICTTGSTASSICTMSPVSWPVAFADTNYSAICTPSQPTSGLQANIYASAKTTTGITLSLQNGQGSAAMATTVAEIDCSGIHL